MPRNCASHTHVVRTAKGHLSRARSSTAKLAQSAADLAKTIDRVEAATVYLSEP
jgi:hypothetical protein